MKKAILFTLIIFGVVIFIFLVSDKLFFSKYYVMPEMTERTKVFAYGNIDDVREYLDTPRATVTMGNYYFLIDRNKPNILEMMFSDYKLNPDMNIKDKDDTPLLYAASEFKPELVAVLVKYGADVNYKNPYGMTPLIAASYTTFEHENPASFEITKMLVEAGADINVVSEFGKTAIEGALFSNDIKRVRYLVENGGDINHLNPSGSNYMFYCDYIECYEYFLNQGFDINSTNNKGKSIFQNSHIRNNLPLSMTKQLLNWGADICHKDNSGDTVLNYIERQRIGPHDKKENPEFYKSQILKNRKTEVYQFLEQEYQKRCLSEAELTTTTNSE